MEDQENMLMRLLEMMQQLGLAQGGASKSKKSGSSSSSDDSDEVGDVRVLEFHKAVIDGNSAKCRRLIQNGLDPDCTYKRGLTALHLAAIQGTTSLVRELLQLNANIEATDRDGDTALILAVAKNQEDVVQLLIDRGANLKHFNNKAMTAADMAFKTQNLQLLLQLEGAAHCLQLDSDLHSESLTVAAQRGNFEILEFWLQNHPKKGEYDRRLHEGRTLAFTAALNGHCDIVMLLDSLGADFDIADDRCNTPLFCAAQNGHLDIVRFLVEGRKCDINHRSITQRTPIFSAINNNELEVVKFLLENGADPDSVDEDGFTPMELAVQRGNIPILRLLVDAGADINRVKHNGYNYALIAAHSDKLEVLKELHELGMSMHCHNALSGSCLLLAASQAGNEEMARWLLERNCDPNHRNEKGVSPAMRAAYNKSIGVLRVLAEGGANLDLPNNLGETAILSAAEKDSLEVVRFLQSKGCSMNVMDHDLKTIAWYAANHGNVDLLRFVQDCDGPLDQPDSDGDSPLMMAVKKEKAEVVAFLVEAGCCIDKANKKSQTPEGFARRRGKRQILVALGLEAPVVPRQIFAPGAGEPGELQHGHSLLDPGFQEWDYILDGGRKKPIGEGGFGKVYKALTDKHQIVAVKVVKSRGMDQGRLEHAVESERRGIEILSELNHPNIMIFLKAELKADGFYIFTELISGHSLFELLQNQKKPFGVSGIQKFTRQMVNALHHLHNRPAPIIHRDIKCSNVMLTNEGVIKLIDFGLAKEVIVASDVFTSMSNGGTICFMAPELFEENDGVHPLYSAKSDVWALGCTVFEMATMRPPNMHLPQVKMIRAIRNGEMPQLPDSLPASLHQFYCDCVIKEKEERPDTEHLFQEALLNE